MGSRLVLTRAALASPSPLRPTATVELALNGRSVVGVAESRITADGELSAAGEAAVKAVTQFLPGGYSLSLAHILPVSAGVEQAVWARLLLSTPERTQPLEGIAGLGSDIAGAAAKAVLSATNRRIEQLLG